MKSYLVSGMLLLAGGIVSIAWAAHPGFDSSTFNQATSATGAPAMPADKKPEEPPGPLSGKVVQTMDSGGYTYLLIESKGERRWAAVNSADVKVGQQVTLKPGSTMVNFTSKALNRTFDRIVFSEGIVEQKGGTKSATPKITSGSAGAAVPFSKITVGKAAGPNAYRIADLYTNQKLNGKKITVRGKVVKVSSGIMDRNWIHLQDGTGSPQKKNHNLVVTSKDLPDVGDIVTITGTLIRNKDFGSGYKYDVIVEKAKVVKETAEPKPATP
jgi:hypothetical protein